MSATENCDKKKFNKRKLTGKLISNAKNKTENYTRNKPKSGKVKSPLKPKLERPKQLPSKKHSQQSPPPRNL